MKYGELMAALKKKPAEHLYLLAGEESYFIDKAEKRILEKLFPEGYKQDDIQILDSSIVIGDLVGIVSTVPFFTDKNVIIVRGTSLLGAGRSGGADSDEGESSVNKKASGREAQLAQLFENMPEFSYLIVEHTGKLDKRKRAYKLFSKHAQVMEAEPVKAYSIGDWLQSKLQELHKSMDGEAYAYFTGAAGMMQSVSLGYLSQELDKLALFMGSDEKVITRAMLDSVLSDMPELDGFAMTNAIGENQLQKALFVLKKQFNDGVALTKLMGPLIYFVRQQLQMKHYLQEGISGNQLMQVLGIKSKFQLEREMRKNRTFSEKLLEEGFLQAADLDYGIKNGFAGASDIEALVVKLCSR